MKKTPIYLLILKVFASCIKEGVLTYEMLKEKYNKKYMRVECHYKCRKTKT